MKTISIYLSILMVVIIGERAMAQGGGDAVYNKMICEYTLHEDGSTSYHEYKEVQLLSHMSFHRLYGESFIIYDPEYQDLKINEAYTIMADGRKVVVPDNAFNKVLPRDAAHAAPYNNLREMVVTHTGLEVGATIYLDYTLTNKAGYMPALMGEEVIPQMVPVVDKKVIIHVPDDTELHYRMLNLRTAPELTEEAGIKTYTFNFKAVQPSSNAWGTDASLLPRLFFSTTKDLDRAYFPFVAQKAFTFQATPEMQEAVDMLKEDNDSKLSLGLAIQKMVASQIGSWNLSIEKTGFRCRTPEETWKSNAGTTIEKTVLMATLMRAAGLNAVPVAVIPGKYYDREVGSLYIMKDFAVQLRIDGSPVYLSATHMHEQDLAYSLKDHKFLVLDGAIESIKTMEPINLNPEIIFQGKLVNDANERIKGELNIKLVGSANPYLSLYRDTAYAKRYAQGVTGVELNILNPNESAFRLELDKEGVFQEYGDYVFLTIIEARHGIASWGFSYIESGREMPIKLKELLTEKYFFTIEIPDGFELVSPVAEINIDNPAGYVRISTRQEENVVTIIREIQLKQDIIHQPEFEMFNQVWQAWMNPSLKEVVLKRSE